MKNNGQISRYLLLLLAFGVVAFAVCQVLVHHFAWKPIITFYAVGLPYMFVPALAACMVEKWRVGSMLARYRLTWKDIVWGQTARYVVLIAIVLPLLVLLMTYLTGNVWQIPGFAHVLRPGEEIEFIAAAKAQGLTTSLPEYMTGENRLATGLAITLASTLLSGILFMPFTLGEEIGWRGLMERYVQLSDIKKSVFIGLIWGVWHAPLISIGYKFGEHNILGIGMMVLATIPASIFFRRALHRTRSLWGPAFVHGYLNTSPVLLFTISGDTLLGPGTGLIFVLAQWMLIGIDVLLDKKR